MDSLVWIRSEAKKGGCQKWACVGNGPKKMPGSCPMHTRRLNTHPKCTTRLVRQCHLKSAKMTYLMSHMGEWGPTSAKLSQDMVNETSTTTNIQ